MEELVDLQIKISYLEDEVQTLNEVVTAQQAVVDSLQKKVEMLTGRLLELEEESRPSRKPPHY